MNKKRVLIVEDDPPNAVVVTSLLRPLGFECDLVTSAEDAIQKLREDHSKWCTVLMDVHLPELSGIEATLLIRKEEQEKGLKPVKIVAVSAAVSKKDKARCLEAGMNQFISKPYTLDDLKSVLLPQCLSDT